MDTIYKFISSVGLDPGIIVGPIVTVVVVAVVVVVVVIVVIVYFMRRG